MYVQKEKNYISLVIYVHNDESFIEKNLLEIDEMFTENFTNFEIILINDFSQDKSIDKVKAIQDKFHAPITILNLSYFHGLELAMVSGQKVAIGDYIFEFDTLSIDYDVSLLIDIYKKSLTGFDIVALSPNVKPSFFNKVFYRLLEISSPRNMKLYTETARILSRRAINRVGILNTNINYRKASYHYSGLPSTVEFYQPTFKTDYNQLSFTKKFNLGYEIMIRYSHIASTISIGLIHVVFCLLNINDCICHWIISSCKKYCEWLDDFHDVFND